MPQPTQMHMDGTFQRSGVSELAGLTLQLWIGGQGGYEKKSALYAVLYFAITGIRKEAGKVFGCGLSVMPESSGTDACKHRHRGRHTHTYTHTHTRARAHAYARVPTHTYTRTHTRIHTHTHAYT